MSDQLPVVGGQLPVRCGCGGEANIYTYEARWKKTEDGYQRSVGCLKCGIATQLYDTEAEAITAWNRAMSGATDTNVGDKEQKTGMWTNHEVACILAELFGDDCACDYCGIDEWLPEKCDFGTLCPDKDLCGVTCWEQYLKHRDDR